MSVCVIFTIICLNNMHTIYVFHSIHFAFLFNLLMKNKINKNVITTNILRHHYRTRANSKRMDNWGEMQKSIKADIDQLKNLMRQMFEMMVALKDVVAVRNEEAQSSHPLFFSKVHHRLVTQIVGIETPKNSLHMVWL